MSASSLWHDRTPGERATLAGLGALAAAALLVAFAWLPLERARTRLQQQLPELRASLGTLERQAEEVRRLRSLPPATSSQSEPLVSLLTAGGGRALPGAQLTVLDGKTLAVQATDVAFGALLEWLAAVQASQALRVREARLEALPAAGRVRGELKLTRP